MQIQVGQTYQTRTGTKVQVLAVNPYDEKQPYIAVRQNDGSVDTYSEDGRFFRESEKESLNDLVLVTLS